MDFEATLKAIQDSQFLRYYGSVLEITGESVIVSLPMASVGAICKIECDKKESLAEIISIGPNGHRAIAVDSLENIRIGNKVILDVEEAHIPFGRGLLGEVVDSFGVSYISNRIVRSERKISLFGERINPLDRRPIDQPLDLGIRTINSCLTCGKGQRQGIFAGSGVGKSVLLGMMAKFTKADVVVIGLIGERGREVREFLERELGEEGLKKSVVVVETADRSPIRRMRAGFVASAIAEGFSKEGANVLLLVDSLTRFAMAQREIGIAAGEPPTTKGYTPSVFSSLSKLVERAGNFGKRGSITGLYTVLVEGDDLEDPIADSARAILDGHIVLSRKIANQGRYPAIDLLSSISRSMENIISSEQRLASRRLRMLLSKYTENEDAIHYQMYVRGSDPEIDEAIDKMPLIQKFLSQDSHESVDLNSSIQELCSL